VVAVSIIFSLVVLEASASVYVILITMQG
jgi:hypothetical protein